jgi:nucleotide-binding universal stress UspA family protein
MSIEGGLVSGDESGSPECGPSGFALHEVTPIGATDYDAAGAVVVVGVDGSLASLHALRQAATVVRAIGGRIVVLYAWAIPTLAGESPGQDLALLVDTVDELEQTAEADALAVCSQAKVPATFMRREGDPARSIIDVAHEVGAVCVVVGATIHGAIASLVLSSVAERLLHHCDVSLVIVRPEPPETGSEA